MKLSELKLKIEQSVASTTDRLREQFAKKQEALEVEAGIEEDRISVINNYKLLVSRAEGFANVYNQILQRFVKYNDEAFYGSIVERFENYPPLESPLQYVEVLQQMMRIDIVHRHSEQIIAAARQRYIDKPMAELESYAKTHAATLKAFGIEV